MPGLRDLAPFTSVVCVLLTGGLFVARTQLRKLAQIVSNFFSAAVVRSLPPAPLYFLDPLWTGRSFRHEYDSLPAIPIFRFVGSRVLFSLGSFRLLRVF